MVIFVLSFLMITTASAHFIGEQYQGGVVFWIDEVAEHGLIASTEDLTADIQWFNGNYIEGRPGL